MEKFPGGRDIVSRESSSVEICPSREADDSELMAVHSSEYLDKVRRGGWSSVERVRMGLPVDPRLYRRCALEAGGSILAGRAALEDGLAANLGGGTHHASADRASGYCIFNDVAVAVRSLRRDLPDLWVMVIDTDAHQGDGTHALFSNDRKTFTYSIHVGKNFPAKKFSGDLDVPLDRWVGGRAYQDAFCRSVERSFLEFEPDLVFWVAGADIHEDDRFGQMKLKVEEIRNRNQFVLDLVRGWNVPLAVVYGGGYNRNVELTNQLHALPVLQASNDDRSQRKISPAAGLSQ
ncbi:histone deacetylase family protein [Puniceicoccus vermicola]|nr:histone deacetylase [Puniceicoccus vermicola]